MSKPSLQCELLNALHWTMRILADQEGVSAWDKETLDELRERVSVARTREEPRSNEARDD